MANLSNIVETAATTEAPAQLTTAEIRVEKRPSPAPEGDDEVPQTLKKQKTKEDRADESMKDVKAEELPLPPTPKKETVLAGPPVEPGMKLLVKKLSSKAKAPTRGSALAAGYDIYRYAIPTSLGGWTEHSFGGCTDVRWLQCTCNYHPGTWESIGQHRYFHCSSYWNL